MGGRRRHRRGGDRARPAPPARGRPGGAAHRRPRAARPAPARLDPG